MEKLPRPTTTTVRQIFLHLIQCRTLSRYNFWSSAVRPNTAVTSRLVMRFRMRLRQRRVRALSTNAALVHITSKQSFHKGYREKECLRTKANVHGSNQIAITRTFAGSATTLIFDLLACSAATSARCWHRITTKKLP